jgi:hypothetical protein
MASARLIPCTALALLAFGCVSRNRLDDVIGCDDGPGPDEARIDLADAIAAAEREHPTALVVEAELGQGSFAPIYEVALLVGDEVHEVFVDAADGKVITTAVDPEDLEQARASAALLHAAKIGMRQAIATAERFAGGSALEIAVDADGFEVLVLRGAGAPTMIELGFDGAVMGTRAHEH